MRAPSRAPASARSSSTNELRDQDAPALPRRARARTADRLLVVGGADYGIDLLTGAQARRVVPAVTRFIVRG